MFALCGLLAVLCIFIAENTALKYTLTTNVSLLTSLSPLVTAILVGFVYKTEKLGLGTWRQGSMNCNCRCDVCCFLTAVIRWR